MKSNNIAFASSTCLAVALASVGCGSGQERHTDSDGSGGQSSALATGAKLHRGAVLPRLPDEPTATDSTVPDNGDVNPYGVAFVPPEFPRGGLLRDDDVIVSNFNNFHNLQGTGTTIVRVNRDAAPDVFFSDPKMPGFSTALGILKGGFVLLGTVPSVDGSGKCVPGPDGEMLNVGAGSLLVIDRHSKVVRTLKSHKLLDGPWDLTIDDDGGCARVFVSNVLSGTVTRLDLRVGERDVRVEDETQIASGYTHRCDDNAFVLGPTGLAFDKARDILYVASTADNKIFAVHHASGRDDDRGTGKVVVDDPVHLHGPLGLVRAANGNLISAQGDAVNADDAQPSEIVEFTDDGDFVDQLSIDPMGGSAFGVALDQTRRELRFAAVDDGNNTLKLWIVR
jgi:hypothetical protein